MSRISLRTRKKIIRHPNFLQRKQKIIGIILIGFGIIELIVTFCLIFFIPDPFISPLPEAFAGKRPVISDDATVRLKKVLEKHAISYAQIFKTAEGDFLIKLKPEGEVYLRKSSNIEQDISSLQLILSRITMEGKQFSRLDLRFEKPVVVFK